MAAPHLTFACELENDALQALITDELIADLVELNAAVSLGLLDLSPERAEVVRRLNRAEVPVIAWLLLPKEHGYYFSLENAREAHGFYQDFRRWVRLEGLRFAAVGLDIEPDVRIDALSTAGPPPWSKWIGRFFRFRQLAQARRIYNDLVAAIHNDGYLVDSYQLPLIVDERNARSTLIQRITGMVDIPADREVIMLYSSNLRPRGIGTLVSYARDADAVGIGSTGGGVRGGAATSKPLTREEFARDLRLAWHYCDQIFIFSLEGCVQNDHLQMLKTFVWDMPILLPETGRLQVDAARRSLWYGIWLAERLPFFALGLLALVMIWRQLRRRQRSS